MDTAGGRSMSNPFILATYHRVSKKVEEQLLAAAVNEVRKPGGTIDTIAKTSITAIAGIAALRMVGAELEQEAKRND